MQSLNISRLVSGGVITNYYCSSKCRHCNYNSSPGWKKEYLDEETARRIFKTINQLGCDSVHIGGGEPLLNLPALVKVLQCAREAGVGVEYVETNSSWYQNEAACLDTLKALKESGIHTLLISMDPFHNEFIPLDKVNGVIKACHKAGVAVFPWQEQFLKEMAAFSPGETHGLEEYKEKYGSGYVRDLAARYRLTMRGRALQTFKEFYPRMGVKDLVAGSRGCSELADVYHFHIDLFGNLLPGLCSGLAVRLEDLGKSLEVEKYPLLSVLYAEGAGGLLKVGEGYGFRPAESYAMKCDLCYEIRSFLVEKGMEFRELQPVEYYASL